MCLQSNRCLNSLFSLQRRIYRIQNKWSEFGRGWFSVQTGKRSFIYVFSYFKVYSISLALHLHVGWWQFGQRSVPVRCVRRPTWGPYLWGGSPPASRCDSHTIIGTSDVSVTVYYYNPSVSLLVPVIMLCFSTSLSHTHPSLPPLCQPGNPAAR